MSPRLPHGYTNSTRRLASGGIEKRYEGPDAAERCWREAICLSSFGDHLPVPEVLERNDAAPSIVMGERGGRHGQELLDDGHARLVLRLVGATLRKLQALGTDTVVGLPGEGSVVVHGDFGPQNMLFDLWGSGAVTAVLDWEFAHLGEPIEDLAWAEWIVRFHHPKHIEFLDELMAESGVRAPWRGRHDAMVRRCDAIMRRCRRNGLYAAEALWRQRLTATEAWTHE